MRDNTVHVFPWDTIDNPDAPTPSQTLFTSCRHLYAATELACVHLCGLFWGPIHTPLLLIARRHLATYTTTRVSPPSSWPLEGLSPSRETRPKLPSKAVNSGQQ